MCNKPVIIRLWHQNDDSKNPVQNLEKFIIFWLNETEKKSLNAEKIWRNGNGNDVKASLLLIWKLVFSLSIIIN